MRFVELLCAEDGCGTSAGTLKKTDGEGFHLPCVELARERRIVCGNAAKKRSVQQLAGEHGVVSAALRAQAEDKDA